MERSISGKESDELSKQFVSKIIGLNAKVINKFEGLKETTLLNNVRDIIGGLERYLEKENEELQGISGNSGFDRIRLLERRESTGLYDHINAPFDLDAEIVKNDIGSVLDFALSFANYKINIFSLWEEEYKGNDVARVFGSMKNNEEERKRKLENLLDAFVHHDW
ncbi:MAG: hypothetical protein M1564_00310 [Candidatus Marsarchaeota archaeon]|jgi:hypothetical protein|nr:hypothetical protein [Candidatus Marsarchaeota archaeon]MCL5430731.1 hypothetical protein [Candidatus Marsarchaeota archaeon]